MSAFAELDLVARTDQLERATAEIRRIGVEGDKAEAKVKKSTSGMEDGMRKLAAAAGTLAGSLAAAFSVGAYIRMADSWSDMRSQLGAAIGDMDNAGKMMQRMTQIANASYSPLNQTVQVYARNVSVLRDLGVSASGAADFTEALNHALVITATKGERAASVQDALSKAMATGKLQADGLETVLANGGKVAEVLASELGTTVSGLRQMATDGKITGDVIANALIGNLESLRDVAAEMPATVGDAFTRIGTNLLSLVGNFDQAVGASSALADIIMTFADSLPEVAGLFVSAGTALAVYMLPSLVAATASTLAWVAALITLRGALIATGVGALVVGAGLLIGYFIRLIEATGSFGGALSALKGVAAEVWDRIAQGAEGMRAIAAGAAGGIQAAFLGAFASVLEAFSSLTDGIAQGWNSLMSSLGMESLANAKGLGETAAASLRAAADTAAANGSNSVDLGKWLIDDAMRPLDSVGGLTASTNSAVTGALSVPVDGVGSGGGGSAASDGFEDRLERLTEQFQTERELVDLWYEESMEILDDRRAMEILGAEGHAEALLAIEEERAARIAEIDAAAYQRRLSDAASLFGQLANIASIGGKKSAVAVATFQAIEGTINAYGAAIKALNTPGLSVAGRFAAYAAVLGAGLKGVASIKSAMGGGGSSGGSGGGSGSSYEATPEPTQAPRIVRLDVQGEGIFADMLRESGQAIVDAITNEGDYGGTTIVMGR